MASINKKIKLKIVICIIVLINMMESLKDMLILQNVNVIKIKNN